MKLLCRPKTRRKFNKTPNNLVGPQLRVFVPWYQYFKMKPMEAVNTVRCLKNIASTKQSSIIWEGIRQLNEISPLRNYDLIIAAPSSFSLVRHLIDEIRRYSGTEDKIVEGLLYKLPAAEMMIDWAKAEREGSSKTIPLLKAVYKTLKDGSFEIKDHHANVRRYLYNFMKVNENHIAVERLKTSRRILFIDDTFGGGATLSEALRVIREINPNLIAEGFCLVHDFPYRTNKLKNFSGFVEFEHA